MEQYIAEFLGTMVLVTINNGTVANVLLKSTKGNTKQHWLLITLGAGLAVTFGLFVSLTISGGHINPAVTISQLSLGNIVFIDAVLYILFQISGGITGAFIVYLAYKKHYDATDDNSAVLATFSTSPAIKSNIWNIITEIVATFFLVGVVISITHSSNNVPNYLLPIYIGLLVMIIGISLGGSTGFAMNPARDLGPRITHSILRLGDSNWKYAIIPIVGPIIGGLLGGAFFTFYLGGF